MIFTFRAISSIVRHSPWPEQSFGHETIRIKFVKTTILLNIYVILTSIASGPSEWFEALALSCVTIADPHVGAFSIFMSR